MGAGADASFVHTVLVRTRMRLRDSQDPERVFRVSKEVAAEAGLVGLRRALDSAPLLDAVATQDTVTLIRSAVRGLLRAADADLGVELRAALAGGDDYVAAGKPVCDWDDAEAREVLIDALVVDALAVLAVCEGLELTEAVAQAAALLVRIIGQDIEQDDDGRFRIARRVAADRVVSTVDPDARHGHKSSARGYDGYKGHVAVDPDSEIVTAATVGPANAGDAAMTEQLLADELATDRPADAGDAEHGSADGDEPDSRDPGDVAEDGPLASGEECEGDGEDEQQGALSVYGDSAYGSGENLERLGRAGADANVKVQPPVGKLAHLLRRSHGGRKARMRGRERVEQDWQLGAAAVNLARLASLGLRHGLNGWHVTAA